MAAIGGKHQVARARSDELFVLTALLVTIVALVPSRSGQPAHAAEDAVLIAGFENGVDGWALGSWQPAASGTGVARSDALPSFT